LGKAGIGRTRGGVLTVYSTKKLSLGRCTVDLWEGREKPPQQLGTQTRIGGGQDGEFRPQGTSIRAKGEGGKMLG